MPVSPPPHATRMFHGVLHEIWQWDQKLFDGSHTTFECVTRQDGVAVIAFLDAETVLLASEEQAGRVPFQGMPGGRLEAGESPEEGARREFHEETGYTAGVMHPFRTIDYTGAVRFQKHLFLATQLTRTAQPNPDSGERIAVRPIAWNALVALALNGALRSQEDMLAILGMEFNPEARVVKERFLTS